MPKINEIFSASEIKELNAPSDLKGFQAVATSWAMIAGSFALVAWHPSVLTVALTLVILGGRHLGLAILMHDAAHYSLFRTRWLNDAIGGWFCAAPTLQHLPRYREHHIRHHKLAGTPQDPDYDLVEPFPVTRASMKRKFFRDLIGLSGLKRVYGVLLMDSGRIEYTVSTKVVPISQEGKPFWRKAGICWSYMHGWIITNAAMAVVLAALGHPRLYLLWLASYLTAFSVFVRIRSIAEHACTELDLDPFKSTRTTHANWLARVTVAPIRVNYHLEHHLLMTVPYFNLPRMHRLLAAKGALAGAFVSPGYLDVMRIATAGKSARIRNRDR